MEPQRQNLVSKVVAFLSSQVIFPVFKTERCDREKRCDSFPRVFVAVEGVFTELFVSFSRKCFRSGSNLSKVNGRVD